MENFEVIKVTTYELVDLLKERNLIDDTKYQYLKIQCDLCNFGTIISYLRGISFDIHVGARTWTAVNERTIMTTKLPIAEFNYNSIW